MKIQIDPHTLERAIERGISIAEIEDVIKSGTLILAKYGKTGKSKVFDFKKTRNGKFYDQKKIDVFYLIEDNVTITVTAYAFYGTWEELK
jgi:hypothetical protein